MRLVIIPDVLKPHATEIVETDDLCKTLYERFPTEFPVSARIYHHQVAVSHEITPNCEGDVEYLQSIKDGTVYVVVYPAGVTELIYAIVFVLLVAVAVMLRPQIPNAAARNTDTGSPNNSLSGRSNKPRINGRIPDIFGTVRSVPDMLAPAYSIFENHIEIENCYMCVGRGTFFLEQIDDVESIRDGDTLISKIEGSAVGIYGPNKSPNSGDAPDFQIGDDIDLLVVTAAKSKAVNGQILRAPNESDALGDFSGKVRFVYPNQIEIVYGTQDFTDFFSDGDPINVETSVILFANVLSPGFYFWNGLTPGNFQTVNVQFQVGGTIEVSGVVISDDPGPYLSINGAEAVDGTLNFNGKYKVSAWTSTTLTLTSPTDSAPGWVGLAANTSFTNVGLKTVDDPFLTSAPVHASFTGEYLIDTVTSTMITLDNVTNGPLGWVNGGWVWMQGLDLNDDNDAFGSPDLGGETVILGAGGSSDGWVGPFVTDQTTINEIICNFIAQQGAWKDDGTTQYTSDVQIQVGVTHCNAAGTALNSETFFTVTLLGSNVVKSQRAVTLRKDVPNPGRQSIRARRITAKDTSFTGQVSDEIRWRDLYAVSPVTQEDFGDVTTIQTRTSATQTAVAISERQVNLLVTRMLPQRVSGSTFGTLIATRSAADILSFVALDPTLGARSTSEVDFDNLYDTIDAIKGYFTAITPSEFCYTFDKDNISFEEMVAIIAEAVFCSAYRQDKLRLYFEREVEDSVMLFNHRNKVPKTEKRSVNFGKDYDGIQYSYVSPADDAVVTFYVPEDQSAVKPQPVESIGVRSSNQAYLHAYRLYNKLLYQSTSVEVTVLSEGDFLALNQRILMEDNTRADVFDGHVVSQASLTLRLSQRFQFDSNDYLIYLQHESGVVEAIAITAGVDDYHVVLDTAPAEPLSLDDDAMIHTLYTIVRAENGLARKAFLLKEKTYPDNFTVKLSVVNYDARYYANDHDIEEEFPVTPEIVKMLFSVEPLVDSTGNGWLEPTGGNPNPGTLDGAVITRPHATNPYWTYQSDSGGGVSADPKFLVSALQWTMEFYVSRPSDIDPVASSWEVGMDFSAATPDFAYEAGMYLSVGWIHNDATNHPIPYITWGANGTIYNFAASPDAPLTLQVDEMTHIALVFDNGDVKVYCHGDEVGNYDNAVAVLEADTGLPFPTNLYAYIFHLNQFYGDTDVVYMDNATITRGVKYTGEFVPPSKALPT